jgi:glycosyltransferase involved in cell wall biosynthesis
MGGMEKLLVEFARHADRSRFDLQFVSLAGRGVAADEIERLGWPITDLQTVPGLHPKLFLRLARLFRSLKADVVHTHSTRPLIYCGPAACIARVGRVIHTRHGQRYGAGRKETAAFRAASYTTNWVVCVSHDSARLTAAEGVSSRRIKTVWNGIDIDRFRLTEPKQRGPAIAVGRLSPEKDFATLVRAAAIVARSDPSFHLEIAGGGPCAEELKRLIHDIKVGESVQLVGQVTDIPALLKRASIFALSSLTEGVSLTILEAMATGLPVAATNVGGNPEVVTDGVTGLLVPPGDPVAMAEALLQLWQNPKLRVLMGKAGRERVETNFNAREMVRAYEGLYSGNG